jgi:SAM-dependent methyltransferase
MTAASTPDPSAWPEPLRRLNAVCPYYTMFPLDFPLQQLAEAGGATRVLDPFCGRGTTLYAARLAGLPAVGIDINPVAAAIASAKIVKVEADDVVALAQQLLAAPAEVSPPDGEFWQWCFETETLQELTLLRAGLSASGGAAAAMLRAILLGVLHGPRNKGLPSYVSNQMPRTYASKPAYAVRYWKERDLEPVRVPVLEVIERRTRRMLEQSPPAAGGRVHLGDSVRKLRSLRQRFDLVVTSPPYYGMRTYVPDQWLRAWFLGGPPEVPYGTDGQIARKPSQEAFTAALAEVWEAVARRCAPGARLAIRFGALPSSRTDPRQMLAASVEAAKAGWVVKEIRSAGVPKGRSRQAAQFGKAGTAVDEIDLIAELTG